MGSKTLLISFSFLAFGWSTASSVIADDNVPASDCFDRAAAYQNVNVEILRSIAFKENSTCSSVISKNTNNTVDVGCMQINSVHFKELKKYGVSPSDLLDQCKNIYVGAWHYKKKIIKYGNNWKAVGAYHTETLPNRDVYAADVYKIWRRNFVNE
jgi:soluble lytic murein transglycosylase-like protein